MTGPLLFTPLELRAVTTRNRVVISPMSQYSAVEGKANDWHFVHLSRFALGGAGIVFTETNAVEARGRNTYGDLGLWADEQVEPLKRITAFLKQHGAVPGIQLGHTGRKAGLQRPWEGHAPLGEADRMRGEGPWVPVGPSAERVAEGWPTPRELTPSDIETIRDAWGAAAKRAYAAGFDAVELHGGHGYLLHQFLSPLANHRTDGYGGTRERRMRFPLEVAEVVRAAWPDDRPVFYRLSAVDGAEGGWGIEDTVIFARELKARGIDVIDCSSGGISGFATAASRIPRGLGFQVPYAERVRRESGVRTMAVGLILKAEQGEQILQSGQADLIAVAREALYNPNWALHAEAALGDRGAFASWPVQYGWWLERREKILDRILEGERSRPAT